MHVLDVRYVNFRRPFNFSQIKYCRLEGAECTMKSSGVVGKGRQLLSCSWCSPLCPESDVATPRSRFKHAACTVGRYVYVFGGKDHHMPLADIWRFHLVHHTWEEVQLRGTKIPHLQGHTATPYKRLVLLFGGELTDPSSRESPLWIYNTDLDHLWRCWVEPNTPVPQNRRDHSSVVHGNKLYIYGGYIDLRGSTSEFWSFNIDEEEWELLKPDAASALPGPRHGHSAVIYRKAMWVLGGMNNLQPCQDLCRYMFTLNKWHQVKCQGSPPQLSGQTAHVHNDCMIIIGGESLGTKMNDVWILSFETCQWQRISINGEHTVLSCMRHASVLISQNKRVQAGSSRSDRSLSVPSFRKQLSSSASADGRPQTSPAILQNQDDGTDKWTRPKSKTGRTVYNNVCLTNKIHPEEMEMQTLSKTKPSPATAPLQSGSARIPRTDARPRSPPQPNKAEKVVPTEGSTEGFSISSSREFLLPQRRDSEGRLSGTDNVEFLELTSLCSISTPEDDYLPERETQFCTGSADELEVGAGDSSGRIAANGCERRHRKITNGEGCSSYVKRESGYRRGERFSPHEERLKAEHTCRSRCKSCDEHSEGMIGASQPYLDLSGECRAREDEQIRSSKLSPVCEMPSSVSLPQNLASSCAARKLEGKRVNPHTSQIICGKDTGRRDALCFCCSTQEARSSFQPSLSPREAPSFRNEMTCTALSGVQNALLTCAKGSRQWHKSCQAKPSERLPSSEPNVCSTARCLCRSGSSLPFDSVLQLVRSMQHSLSMSSISGAQASECQAPHSAQPSDGRWAGSSWGTGKSKSTGNLAHSERASPSQDLLLEDLDWIQFHGMADKPVLSPRMLAYAKDDAGVASASPHPSPLSEVATSPGGGMSDPTSGELHIPFASGGNSQTLPKSASAMHVQVDEPRSGAAKNEHESCCCRDCCSLRCHCHSGGAGGTVAHSCVLCPSSSNIFQARFDEMALVKKDAPCLSVLDGGCGEYCSCRDVSCLLPNQAANSSGVLCKCVCRTTLLFDSLSCCHDNPMSSSRSLGSGPRTLAKPEKTQGAWLYKKNCSGSRRQITRRSNEASGAAVPPRQVVEQVPQLQLLDPSPREESGHEEAMELETAFVLVIGGQVSFSSSPYRQPLALWKLDVQ